MPTIEELDVDLSTFFQRNMEALRKSYRPPEPFVARYETQRVGSLQQTKKDDSYPTVIPQAIVLGPAIRIDSVDPDHGTMDGGTGVTINGSGLKGATLQIFFVHPDGRAFLQTISSGDPEGTFVVITTTESDEAVTVDVKATLTGGIEAVLENAFTYEEHRIDRVDPNNGPASGGTAVTIFGTGIGADIVTVVLFGGTAATITGFKPDGTEIYVTTPAHVAGTVDVTVNFSGGTSTTLVQGFSYGSLVVNFFKLTPTNMPQYTDTVVTIHATFTDDYNDDDTGYNGTVTIAEYFLFNNFGTFASVPFLGQTLTFASGIATMIVAGGDPTHALVSVKVLLVDADNSFSRYTDIMFFL